MYEIRWGAAFGPRAFSLTPLILFLILNDQCALDCWEGSHMVLRPAPIRALMLWRSMEGFHVQKSCILVQINCFLVGYTKVTNVNYEIWFRFFFCEYNIEVTSSQIPYHRYTNPTNPNQLNPNQRLKECCTPIWEREMACRRFIPSAIWLGCDVNLQRGAVELTGDSDVSPERNWAMNWNIGMLAGQCAQDPLNIFVLFRLFTSPMDQHTRPQDNPQPVAVKP